MKSICYRNTITNLPNWNPNDQVHIGQPLGFAYEDSNHFVHLYGWDDNFKGISIGLTVVEGKKEGVTLEEWVLENFGAEDIKTTINDIGHSVKGVWRPGIYYNSDVVQAIGTTEQERFLSEQSIRVLIQKLDEIFLFIEPSNSTKDTYGHKIRELLILSCTEIENFWNSYLIQSGVPERNNGFKTTDYVKLKDKLFLDEFEFELISYPELGCFSPFASWNAERATQSLDWYNAYNKTKHNRTAHFNHANLYNAINSVVGALIMHCVKFGPYTMFEGNNHFASVVQQLFTGKLSNDCRESFYIPKIELQANSRTDKFVFDPSIDGLKKNYEIDDLIIL